jgi:hypothetical protein
MDFTEKTIEYTKKKLGIPTLECGTGEDWENYDKYLKNQWPKANAFFNVLYSIDSFFRRIRRLWKDKVYYPIRYRIIDKYHIVKTDLKPNYYDKDTIMLHACFSLLVDYVEKECAWMYELNEQSEQRSNNQTYNSLLDRVKGLWNLYLRRKCWKPNEKQGLAYLDWASSLTLDEGWGIASDDPHYGQPSQQALYAREIKQLYLWWKHEYANRIDPYDMYDHNDFSDKEPCFLGCPYSRTAAKLIQDTEDKYIREEEEMLIRLMKIRKGLWI